MVELLSIMDDDKSQIAPHIFATSALRLQLYPWQAEVLAACGKGMPTALVGPNGCGKSSVVLTSLILWFLSEYPCGRCVVTSGSWTQLKSQVFDSLRRFSSHPLFHGFEFLDSSVKTPAGGYALGISVDEAFKAEGYHQRDGSPVLLIIDEGKAVSDGVFESCSKCTPTFQIIASSAGPAAGKLYRVFSSESEFWFRRRVSYHQCPHLSETQRLADLETYGEGSTFYRNRWLSEFATDAGEAVISLDAIRECIAHPPPFQPAQPTAFVDFGASGDSTVLALSTGNKIEIIDHWRDRNTMNSLGKLINHFKRLNLQSWQISGDNGGLGYALLDRLAEQGWHLKRVDNGAAAQRQDVFVNLVSELWNNFATLVQRRQLILPNNERLIHELTNRNRRYDSRSRIGLESKEDMRSRGLSSPDLADSVVGSVMSPGGWGSFAQNLHPGSQEQLIEDIQQTTRQLRRQRSPFFVEHVDFSRM